MEEELKKQRTDANKPVDHPTKSWKFDWHFSWKPSASTRLIVIILSAFLIASVLPSSCTVRINVDQPTETSLRN